MIRVLQCVSNMDRAGIETMLMNYYRNIDRENIQFDFLVNKSKKGDYDDEILSLGGRIFKSPGLNPFKFKNYQRFMEKLFQEHPEYKIIHCQNESMGFYALKAAKDNNIPVRIAHSHNTNINKDYKYPIKMICRKNILKVSNYQYACGVEAGKYLFKKKVPIIHNAINTSFFVYNKDIRDSIRKQYNVQDNFLVGCVCRFDKQKNPLFLLDIFYELLKIKPTSKLLLVGDGNLKEKIVKKIKKLNIEDKVILTGNVPNVNELYQAMDIFLLPSLFEGLPVVGIEAQAAGLKCFISSNVSREVDITGNIIFYSIKNNSKKWAELINEQSEYERYDTRQKIIDAGYDIYTESKKLENMYKRLLKEVQKNENSNDWA